MVRLANVFSSASSVNVTRYSILDKLMIAIEEKLADLEERDVIILIKSYENIDSSVLGNARLFNKLNKTVADLAAERKDEVDFGFLVNYLSAFFDLPNNRDLSKE